MIFEINIETLDSSEEVPLYYPADETFIVNDPVVVQNVGDAGTCTFDVPYTNTNYDLVKEKAILTIYKDGQEWWRGDIREVQTDFNKTKSVYAVEDLSWLYDVSVDPSKDNTHTYQYWLQSLVATYNAKIGDAKKQFIAGNVSTAGNCPYEVSNYESSVYSVINEVVRNSDYVRVRRENGSRYIDIVKLEDYGVVNSQAIRFGENLLDYASEFDTSSMCNVLHPYGAETEDELYEGVLTRIQGTTLQNANSIQIYGRIEKNVIFETEESATLERLAQAYITRYSQPQLTISADAFDLAHLYEDTQYIEIGDRINIVAEPFGVDIWLSVMNKQTNLQNVGENHITMSATMTKNSFTSQAQKITQALNSIPSEKNIVTMARKDVTTLLSGGDGGNVVFGFSNDGKQLIELYITDNANVMSARKVYRWDANGLAFSLTGINGNYTNVFNGSLNANLLAGSISADLITSGAMSGDRISGGTVNANVTGNVTGNLTGNVSGNVTGNVTGDVNGSASNSSTFAINAPSIKLNCSNIYMPSYYGGSASQIPTSQEVTYVKSVTNGTATTGKMTFRNGLLISFT